MLTDPELQLKAVRLRKLTLEAISDAGAGHTGGGADLTAKYAKYAKGEKNFGLPCSRISRGSRFNSLG